MPRGACVRIVSVLGLVGACAAAAHGQGRGEQPDASMLMYPDVSKTDIVFVYQNDIWLVPRDGGQARPIASPPGREAFPRFSADGSEIAFVGNYEGNRDLYIIPAAGGVAARITHHPANEILCDWTPEGDLLYYASGLAGLRRQSQLFTVGEEAGMPVTLPVPYGAAGSISGDGEWLAYTPYNTDFRTWKRYRGGLASDIWLFNLKNGKESRRVTTFDGTDTQPMWWKSDLYYLSDAGPEHRLNIWKYELGSKKHTQVTKYADHDVKWPSMGPGPDGKGELVFQAGPDLCLMRLDKLKEKGEVVHVRVPGEHEHVRAKQVDFSKFITGGAVSPTGMRIAVEARGDIWTLPAEKGISRNLTGTSGVAERDPKWSPDGRWIAYLSDASGEYEIFVVQSDGKEEARAVTSDGSMFRFLGAWSPDSKKLINYDKSGRMFVLDVEGGSNTLIHTDQWAQRPPVSWSHDSRWIAFSAGQANQQGAVMLHDTKDGTTHQATDPFFDASSPAFDRKGDFLYYVAASNFAPTYSSIDTTYIYDKSQTIVAVPLRGDVENPFAPEIDEEEWDDEDADKNGEAKDGADAEDGGGDADDDAAGDDEDNGDGDEADAQDHPLHGVWKGKAFGPAPMFPEAGVDYTMTFIVDEEGGITGTSETMGEESTIDVIDFNEGTGELKLEQTDHGIKSTSTGKVDGEVIEGTWKVEAMGLEGTFRVELTDEEPDLGDVKDDKPAEVVEIELEGFQHRGMRIDVPPGALFNLAVGDGNKLFYMRAGDPLPSVKMFDLAEHKEGEREVLGGVGYFEMSGDGKSLGVGGPQGMAVVKAATGQSWGKMVPMDSMSFRVDPREEWSQMLRDAWRIHRDFFYEPTMHGVDWPAIYDRYAAMLEHASSREDLSYLIGEMIAELNVGHAYYWGGDVDQEPQHNVGLLGIDVELVEEGGAKAYRIAKIHEGAVWDADARNPLRALGVNAKEGEFILAVNGSPIDTDHNFWSSFQNLAGKVTELTISPTASPDDEDARDVLVTPIGDEGDLRYRSWIEKNRAYVAEKTSGRVGYIYVPNTGVDGQNDLYRQFFGQRDKEGLIIDERWNGGGQIPTRFIELLNRPVTNYWRVRDGNDWTWPPDSHQGPKVMLINGAAGSGGDMFPALFRQMNVGKIIGTRTWGGLVGISGNPGLIDGGYTAVPTFGFYEKDGTWGIEGHGVDPDIEVIDDPALMVDGGDPQLDAAIRVIEEEIGSHRYVPATRPQSPDRKGMGIPDTDR